MDLLAQNAEGRELKLVVNLRTGSACSLYSIQAQGEQATRESPRLLPSRGMPRGVVCRTEEVTSENGCTRWWLPGSGWWGSRQCEAASQSPWAHWAPGTARRFLSAREVH